MERKIAPCFRKARATTHLKARVTYSVRVDFPWGLSLGMGTHPRSISPFSDGVFFLTDDCKEAGRHYSRVAFIPSLPRLIGRASATREQYFKSEYLLQYVVLALKILKEGSARRNNNKRHSDAVYRAKVLSVPIYSMLLARTQQPRSIDCAKIVARRSGIGSMKTP